jgi:HK97 family phage portal protein
VALFFRGGGSHSGQARATNLPQLIDEATGGRRGAGGSSMPVGWSGALAIPAVWGAVRLRANIIASLPVGVYRDRDGIPTQMRRPGVLEQPSADFGMTSWLHASQIALDLRGNNFGRIVARDPVTYLPTQVELVHPDTVTVRTATDGTVEYRFAGRVQDPFDVWHERQNEVPGSVVGMSPITAAAAALGIIRAAENYGGQFFDEALTPSALLSSDAPIDEDAAKIVKARVRATQAGREPLVLGGNWKYDTLSISPTDALLLDVMRYGREDVALLFDVPGEMINAPAQGSSVTYANREQRAQDLLAFRLGPAIRRREEALSRLTVRGQYVKLNTASLLRTDLAGRMAAYDKGLKLGVYAHDEVRALEERPPLTPEQVATLQTFGLLGAKTTPTVTVDGEPAADADATTTQTGATV